MHRQISLESLTRARMYVNFTYTLDDKVSIIVILSAIGPTSAEIADATQWHAAGAAGRIEEQFDVSVRHVAFVLQYSERG